MRARREVSRVASLLAMSVVFATALFSMNASHALTDPTQPTRRPEYGGMNVPKRPEARVVLVGDSITEGWKAHAELWQRVFGPYQAMNLGVSGDRVENALWRVGQGGELDGLSPALVLVMIGTNNLPDGTAPQAVARGIRKLIASIQAKCPDARVLLMSLIPRSRFDDRVKELNAFLAQMPQRSKSDRLHYLDIDHALRDPQGLPERRMLPDGLHLSRQGYETWGGLLAPILSKLVGPAQAGAANTASTR